MRGRQNLDVKEKFSMEIKVAMTANKSQGQ